MRGKVPPLRVSAIVFGIVAGLLAVGAQVFFGMEPPPAYAICMTCHPRDMINWLVNHVAGTHWEIAPVSATVPLLTTVGLFIGAHVAARRNQEMRRVSLGKRWRSFVYGGLVMNAGIIVLGCPTRLLLLSAYGEVLALVALVGVVIGISIGTLLLKRGIFY